MMKTRGDGPSADPAVAEMRAQLEAQEQARESARLAVIKARA